MNGYLGCPAGLCLSGCLSQKELLEHVSKAMGNADTRTGQAFEIQPFLVSVFLGANVFSTLSQREAMLFPSILLFLVKVNL